VIRARRDTGRTGQIPRKECSRSKRPTSRRLSSTTGLFLAVFAVVTFYLAIASLRTDLVNEMVLWLAFASIVLLSIGARATTQSKGKQSHAERVEGIICGVDGGE